jgi:hypothetical protein
MKNLTLKDKHTEDVLGFLVAKGLLIAPNITPRPLVKLDLKAVIRVGLEIEPRVIEVLPAALLHFPKSFRNTKKLPKKIREVLDHIQEDRTDGPSLAGIKYEDMRRWANTPLKDLRVVPENKRRIMKSIRLSPDTLKILKTKAREAGVSETEYIENLICSAQYTI